MTTQELRPDFRKSRELYPVEITNWYETLREKYDTYLKLRDEAISTKLFYTLYMARNLWLSTDEGQDFDAMTNIIEDIYTAKGKNDILISSEHLPRYLKDVFEQEGYLGNDNIDWLIHNVNWDKAADDYTKCHKQVAMFGRAWIIVNTVNP